MTTIKRIAGDYVITTVNPTDQVEINTSNVSVTGNVYATGNIEAGPGSYFFGDGRFLTNVIANAGAASILQNGTSNVDIPVTNGNVTIGVSSVPDVVIFSSTGAVINGTANITGNANIGGNVAMTANATVGGTLSVTGNATLASNAAVTGNATVGGTMSVTGNATVGANLIVVGNTSANVATANFFVGDGRFLTNIVANVGTVSQIANGTSNITIPVSNGNILVGVSGTDTLMEISNTRVEINLNTPSTSQDTGALVLTGGLGVAGNVNADRITGNFFVGDGGGLSNIGIAGRIQNGTSNVNIPVANGNVTIGVSGTANVLTLSSSGSQLNGNVLVLGNSTIVGLSTVNGNSLVNGNMSATGNITSNFVTAAFYLGDGRFLTNVVANTGAATILQNGNSNVAIPTPSGEIIFAANGTPDVVFVTDTGFEININTPSTSQDTGALLVTGGIGVLGNVHGDIINANLFVGNNAVINGNVIAQEFEGDLKGSVFADDSTLMVDAINNQIFANLIFVNEITGDLKGSVFADDSALMVDAINNQIFANAGIFDDISVSNLADINTVNATTVSVSGNVITDRITANVANLTTINATTVSIAGNVTIDNVIANTANVTTLNATTVSVSGNTISNNVVANLGNITTINATSVSVAGNVVTNNVIANLGNITTINATTVSVAGNVTSDNVIANTANVSTIDVGNITGASGYFDNLSGNVANLTTINATTVSASGNVNSGNVNTTAIYSPGNLTLVPAGNVVLNGGRYINNVINPVQAQDAATKQYVDNAVSSGIHIHDPVLVETPVPLPSATYTQGGNTFTVSQTIAGNTVVFSTAAGLQFNDQLWFANSFQGIAANTSYFVVSTPNASAAVLSTSYSGAPVNNITSATGLTEGVRVNSGIGATLTATSNGNLIIDSVTMSVADRVLVDEQSNQMENGVYVVTQTGNISAPWILTRATDADKYVPDTNDGIDQGSYFYVQSGNIGAGTSFVVTQPAGPLILGYDNIEFTQFSASQVYSANTAAGLNLVGTVFSAQVDNNTTEFDGNGNIVVKPNANLTTPNIGAATGTSVSLTGNVTGGNINTAGVVTATGNVTGGNIITGGIVNATGNVTGSNLLTNGTVQIAHATSAQGELQFTDGVGSSFVVEVGTGLSTWAGAGSLNLITSTSPGGNIGVFVAQTETARFTTTGMSTTGAFTATGNITGGNVITGGILTATGNIRGGNIITGGIVNASGNITGAALVGTSLTVSTGNVTCGNIVNANGNGVGNIGSASNYFNTVFATATSAQYADLAECYLSDRDYKPGTVVEFGGVNEVTISSQSHSTRIAGVVSTNPAYVMNSGLDGAHVVTVALTGRVPCQVYGKINKGDCLVASAVEGVATVLDMEQYRPACIVGKAMQDYDSDEIGVIEISVGRN